MNDLCTLALEVPESPLMLQHEKRGPDSADRRPCATLYALGIPAGSAFEVVRPATTTASSHELRMVGAVHNVVSHPQEWAAPDQHHRDTDQTEEKNATHS